MKNINGWIIPETGDKFVSAWGQYITDFMSGHAPLFTSAVGASGYSNQFSLSGHNHNELYLGLSTSAEFSLSGHNHDGVYASSAHQHGWNDVSATPTTISGYGITDALQSSTSAYFATSAHTHPQYVTSSSLSALYIPQSTSGSFASSAHQHEQSDIVSSAGWITSAISLKENSVNKGQPNGYASLDETGHVPTNQLPSYVDEVLEYPSLSAFPVSGTTGIIYVAIDSNFTYRWGETIYVRLDNPQIPVTSVAGRTGDVVLSASDITDINNLLTGYSLSGHNHNNLYLGLSTSAEFSLSGHNHSWNQISATPITLSGYGITDALQSSTSAWFATSAHQHQQSDIISSAGWITSATTLTENVISTVSAGAIIPGQTLTSGMSFTSFVKNLLLKTFYPTFVVPSATLASSLASSVESGTTGNVTLTVTYNRGQINGKSVGGIWEPSTFQDYRAGIASNYLINSINMGTSSSNVVTNYQVVDNSNTWNSTVTYSQGPQPVDSLGANYSTPLTSGTLSPTVTVTGKRKAFYGTDSSSNTPYTSSSQIRAIAGSVLGPVTSTAFTINIPIGAKMVVFAYPSTLRDVNSVLYVEGLNASVKEIFTQTTVSVEGVGGYTAINYKVYTYVPASPFTATATYNVTI